LEIDWSFNLLILLLLIIISAFFSGSEVALFSIDKRATDDISNNLVKRYLTYLIDHPRRLLVTVLLGNTIANVAASVVAVNLALNISKDFSLSKDAVLTVQIIVLTIIIVLFADLTPKVLASKKPVSFAKVVTFPMYWISAILYPISEILTEIIRISVSKLKLESKKVVILPEEIQELSEIGKERGTLIKEEHGIIQSLVEFSNMTVQEIMTARVDVLALQTDMKFDGVLEILRSSGYSRLPLFNQNIDEIVGIVYAKDFLPYLKNEEIKKSFMLTSLSRKVIFVPTTKKINELFYEFQKEKVHIAIVVDEYGGTAGLVTLEDIIEEVLGEIRDEYDTEENPVTKIDDNHYSVLGKLSISDLNELLNLNIKTSEADFETVAGLVLNQAGNIPKEGYSFMLDNYKFTVKEVLKKRIKKVQIEKLPTE
jgi:magnesium and cobalt exporter, CNNM family